MSALTLFLIVGPIAMLAGIAMMVVAIRGRPGTNPKSTILLIAGMMGCAFGMLLTAFAIGSAGPAPVSPGA